MTANYDSEKSTVSLRQYVESLISESDKRTDAQFIAAKEAVAAALTAAKEAVAAALAAQEKLAAEKAQAAKEALAEAQVQLNLYKQQSNEWRATLNDLIAKMMIRPEIVGLFAAADGAARAMSSTVDTRMTGFDKRLLALEGWQQRLGGQVEAAASGKETNRWTFEKVLSILAIILSGIAIVWHTVK